MECQFTEITFRVSLACLIWATSWQNLFMPYAKNKGAGQPEHPHSLISAFVVRWLGSIIPLVSISEILSLHLASVAAQAGLCLTWSQTPKTGFLVTRLIYKDTPRARGTRVFAMKFRKSLWKLFYKQEIIKGLEKKKKKKNRKLQKEIMIIM